MTDHWPLVHAERAALAADLTGLAPSAWDTPSLCAGLSVREVLAHLTAGATLGPLRWFAGVLRCRFDFDAQVLLRLREQLGDSPADTLARFTAAVSGTTKPPLPVPAMLGEIVVHAADIRRPLGLPADRPIATLTTVAGYYARSDQVVLARGRVRGLRLAATDGPFRTGDGPLVSGPTQALISAMTGRAAFCAELTGDGVATLRDRCGTGQPGARQQP